MSCCMAPAGSDVGGKVLRLLIGRKVAVDDPRNTLQSNQGQLRLFEGKSKKAGVPLSRARDSGSAVAAPPRAPAPNPPAS